jgi:hypothetical protein
VDRGPEKADDDGPLKERRVQEETERREKDKKKATPNTCSKISA